MHLTLKQETTRPAAKNFLQQQARFDLFIECFNQERPHQCGPQKSVCGRIVQIIGRCNLTRHNVAETEQGF
jgi:hypothetical protein